MENKYRDDPGARGMQAEAKAGTSAERIQAVIADEAQTANVQFMELVRAIEQLIIGIKKLVTIIAVLVTVVGVAMMYLVAQIG